MLVISYHGSKNKLRQRMLGLSARLRVCVYVCLCLSLRGSLQLVIT
jgi:hypothetical protein